MNLARSGCGPASGDHETRFGRLCAEWRSDPAFSLLLLAAFAAPFTFPVARLLLAVVLMVLVVRYIRLRRFPPVPAVAWIGLAFILLACIVTIHGANPDIGCRKLRKLAWFAGIPITAILVSDAVRLRNVLMALTAGSTVLALHILAMNPIDAMCSLKAGEFDTFGAALINEGSMTDGQRLTVGLLASLGLLAVRRMKLPGQVERLSRAAILPVAIVIQAAAFVMNFKRGSWIAALVVIGVFVAIRIRWKAVLLLGLVALLSLLLPPVKERIVGLKTEFEPYHGGRITMWRKIAPELIRRYPWGLGYRSLTNGMMREIAPEVESDRDHLHSNIVQLLVATGWAGLALYMAWMARALWDGWRFFRCATGGNGGEKTMALALFMMLSALLLNGLVEYNFGDAELVLAYGFIMGSSAAGFRRCVSC